MALPRLSEDRPKDINNMLEKYGNWTIRKMRIVRKPLNGIIEKLANIVTKGDFEKRKKINVAKIFPFILEIIFNHQKVKIM